MNFTESKDFEVNSANLKDVRIFVREVFDKSDVLQEQKDELVLVISEAFEAILDAFWWHFWINLDHFGVISRPRLGSFWLSKEVHFGSPKGSIFVNF